MIAAIIIMYWIDIGLTIYYLKLIKKYYRNTHEREINYHRHFMKRFGIIKGTVISGSIGTVFVTGLCLIANTLSPLALYVIIGMQVMLNYGHLLDITRAEESYKWIKRNIK